MIQLLKEHNRLKETLFMGFLTLMCLALSIFRYIYTDNNIFMFLNWNLFLAFVPWGLTSIMVLKPNYQKNTFTIFVLLGSWLLFFPNAPYILTDLFHIRLNSSIPIWFDLVLILSFAWTGLLFGFLSLWDIEKILNKSLKPLWVTSISTGLLFIGSFGVYIGRYLRWNSWDVVNEPVRLMVDLGDRIINPSEYRATWGMTVLMGLFLNMIYWSFRLIRMRDK